MSSATTVIIHGGSWDYSHVQIKIDDARKITWKKERWHPRAALVDKKSKSSTPYSGRPYDAAHFEVIENGWNHDHCEICWWTLFSSEKEEEGTGYTDGAGDWLCLECFHQFIQKNETEPNQ